MRNRLVIACALASAVTLGACAVYAQTAQHQGHQIVKSAKPMKVSSRVFVPKAQISDLYEIEAGKIAVQRAQKKEVREFAQQMVDHHTRGASKFSAAVREAGMQTPAASLDTEHLNMREALRTASNSNFDRVYVTQQLEAHEKAVALHRSYAATGDKAPLKAAARETIPMVEHHLQDIRSISAGIAGDT